MRPVFFGENQEHISRTTHHHQQQQQPLIDKRSNKQRKLRKKKKNRAVDCLLILCFIYLYTVHALRRQNWV